jgi:hypothetical protein
MTKRANGIPRCNGRMIFFLVVSFRMNTLVVGKARVTRAGEDTRL